jgi:hypothetical protein
MLDSQVVAHAVVVYVTIMQFCYVIDTDVMRVVLRLIEMQGRAHVNDKSSSSSLKQYSYSMTCFC